MLILHETPGSRYSLYPGDRLSSGSISEEIHFGETNVLGIVKEKRIMAIQKEKRTCKCVFLFRAWLVSKSFSVKKHL